uniref:Acyltransferase n=1 Tax=Varanus komodoensis TaxID=61221 RepID=A0A8D2IQ16_VARKO
MGTPEGPCRPSPSAPKRAAARSARHAPGRVWSCRVASPVRRCGSGSCGPGTHLSPQAGCRGAPGGLPSLALLRGPGGLAGGPWASTGEAGGPGGSGGLSSGPHSAMELAGCLWATHRPPGSPTSQGALEDRGGGGGGGGGRLHVRCSGRYGCSLSSRSQLVKTAELPPTRNYVLGSHPHGIICAGAFATFCTESTGFSLAFPGLRPSLALLAGLFYLPVYRDYMMSSGMVPVHKRSLDSLLRGGPGRAVVIVVGGAAESLDCAPGEHRVHLLRRRGFVRLALQHGADLVPVYSFGENDIFQQVRFPEGSCGRWLQLRFKQLTGFAPCIFRGRSLFSSRLWGILPLASPITVVVGKPISVPRRPQPTEEEVKHFHALYVEALQQLFEEHKGSCGIPASQRLTIT